MDESIMQKFMFISSNFNQEKTVFLQNHLSSLTCMIFEIFKSIMMGMFSKCFLFFSHSQQEFLDRK